MSRWMMTNKVEILRQRAEQFRKLADTVDDHRAKQAAIELADELEERADAISKEHGASKGEN